MRPYDVCTCTHHKSAHAWAEGQCDDCACPRYVHRPPRRQAILSLRTRPIPPRPLPRSGITGDRPHATVPLVP